MRTFIIAFFCFLSGAAWAQTGNISGVVLDAANGEALMGVNVVLKRQSDTSLQVAGVASDPNGRFRFDSLRADTYALRLTYLGYERLNIKNIYINTGSFPLDTIRLREDATQFGEVVVEARALTMQLVGDTIQYNSAAYKTMPDAMVEDLIKKMPGIQIENGVVKAQGQVVKKITIDGKDYFGDDVMTAIKNIPASEVDKIQIFNTDSDQAALTGISDAQQIKGMNIVTKSGNLKGQFGQIEAGYGTNSRYNVGGNYNYFGGGRRITVLGRANNIGEQGFSFKDMMISDGQNDPVSLWGNDAFDYGYDDGINSSQVIGVNYNDKWGKKIDVSASYSGGYTQNKNATSLARTYIAQTSDGPQQHYTEETNARSQALQHRANMRFKFKLDSLTTLEIKPSIGWRSSYQLNDFQGVSTLDSAFLNSTNSTKNNSNGGVETSYKVSLQRKMRKPRRSFRFEAISEQNKNNNSALLISQNNFASNFINRLNINQLAGMNTQANSLNATLTYTEPLNKNWTLSTNYVATRNYGRNRNFTNAFGPDNNYSQIDTLLSNDFVADNFQQRPSIGINFEPEEETPAKPTVATDSTAVPKFKPQFKLELRLAYQHNRLNGKQLYPDTTTVLRDFHNLLPYANCNIQLSPQRQIHFYYNPVAYTPSVRQLQNLVNNQNPLFLTSGNNQLRQTYMHSLGFNYSGFDPKKNTVYFLSLNTTITQNYIGNSITIANTDTLIQNQYALPQGARFSQSENLGNAFKTSLGGSFSFPVEKIESDINFYSSINYNKLPSRINNQISYNQNLQFYAGGNFDTNVSERFETSVGAYFQTFYSSNTRQFAPPSRSFSLASHIEVKYYMSKRIFAEVDFWQDYTANMSQGFNRNYFLLNAKLGMKCLPKNRGELAISVFDALAQNIDISRQLYDIYYEDSKTTVLRRYFMLTFVYRINQTESKPEGNIIFIGG